MKIYEIGTGYTPIPARMGAATEIVVEELTRSFLKNGEDVNIIDIFSENRPETDLPIIDVKLSKIFTSTDVSLGIMHKLKRVFYSVALAKKIKNILKNSEEKCVLHFHNQYNFFFCKKLVPKKLQKKAITAYTVHSYIWTADWDEIKSTVKKKYFQEIFCIENADAVFVLNELTKANILENLTVDEKKVVLIDNGVNTDVYNILTETLKDEAKAEYGLQSKKVFVQVGSVCDRKNQLGALKLLCPIMIENKDVAFCYAGGIISAEYQDSILNFAKENGIENQVKYIGEIQPGAELNKVYNMAEAMIFPSKAEGFSLVILEAMSAGVPVVINNNLEFKLSEKCLKFDNDGDFVEIINSLMRSNENREGNQAQLRQAIIEQYSWDRISQKYCTEF